MGFTSGLMGLVVGLTSGLIGLVIGADSGSNGSTTGLTLESTLSIVGYSSSKEFILISGCPITFGSSITISTGSSTKAGLWSVTISSTQMLFPSAIPNPDRGTQCSPFLHLP